MIGTAVRYASGLREFLHTTLTEERCLEVVRAQLEGRQRSFLRVMRQAVFGNPRSPYLPLLERAGMTMAGIERMVSAGGIEAALHELLDRGVFLTVEEFKGRTPIRRNGMEVRARPSDFDNPLIRGDYAARTGGSRGPRTRVVVDFGLLFHEAAQTRLFLTAFGLERTPIAMWREAPPGMVGVKNWLRYAKVGRPVERWFTQQKTVRRAEDLQFLAFTLVSRALGRLWGRPMPVPEHVPPSAAIEVARWMAGQKRTGTPAMLDANASTGARVCQAAIDKGLDIAGSFFRLSAEPFTPAKARLVAQAGCRAASFYSAAEIGYIGLACGRPAHVDDVHIMTDKVALIERQVRVGPGGPEVRDFLLTTLLPVCSKLMLNVSLGDCGVLDTRECGCLFGQLGFRLHAHDVRSFEKLTTSGNTFLGTELLALVEEELPSRFGGGALDYQFVEEEDGGLPVVHLRISPRLGDVHEADVLTAVYAALSAVPGGRLMTRVWRDGGTLRVVRKDPDVTGALKVLPLHLHRENRGS